MGNIKLLILVMAMVAVMTGSGATAAERNPAADRAIGGSWLMMSGIAMIDWGANLNKTGSPFVGIPLVLGGASMASGGTFLAMTGIPALVDPEAWTPMMASAWCHAVLATALGTAYFALGSYLRRVNGYEALGFRVIMSGIIWSIGGGLWAIHAGTFIRKRIERKREVSVTVVPPPAPSLIVRW